jgi:hypothetical protein
MCALWLAVTPMAHEPLKNLLPDFSGKIRAEKITGPIAGTSSPQVRGADLKGATLRGANIGYCTGP